MLTVLYCTQHLDLMHLCIFFIPCIIIKTLFVKKHMSFDWIKSLWVGTVLNEVSPILVGLIAIFSYPIFIIAKFIVRKLCLNQNDILITLILYIFHLIFNIIIECGILNIWFEKKAKDTYRWLMYPNLLIITSIWSYLALLYFAIYSKYYQITIF